jgi:hypothetical protein
MVGHMKRDLGEEVHYYEVQDAVHGFKNTFLGWA